MQLIGILSSCLVICPDWFYQDHWSVSLERPVIQAHKNSALSHSHYHPLYGQSFSLIMSFTEAFEIVSSLPSLMVACEIIIIITQKYILMMQNSFLNLILEIIRTNENYAFLPGGTNI